MHEQQNVQLIQKIYAAFAAGDVNAILDNVADDAAWDNHGPATIPYAGARSGKKQIAEFFQAIGDSTTEGKVTSESFVAQGDTVVSLGRFTATVRHSGAKIDTPVAHVFIVHAGKVAKWTGFLDSAHVAEAHTRGKAAEV